MRNYYDVGYSIIDPYANFHVYGTVDRGYEADLEQVEWFAFEHLATPPSTTESL